MANAPAVCFELGFTGSACADAAAKHLGILAGSQHFIHAYEQAAVVRSALVPGWRRRIAGVFRFPDP